MKQTDEIKINKLFIIKKVNMVVNYTSLTHLYLPIIGSNAVATYLWMIAESDFIINENLPSTLTRLANYLNVSKHILLKKIFRNLEGVSLIKTYLDIDKEFYLCHIFPPQMPLDFFSNTFLKTLAEKKLSTKYWERTIAHLQKKMNIPSNALNVSCNFESFYATEIEKASAASKKDLEGTVEFDSDFINARLTETDYDNINLSASVKRKIQFLTKLYSFHIGDVVEIIKHCKKDYEKINVSTITKAFADIYEKKAKDKPDSFFEIDDSKTILTSLTPPNFIFEHEDRNPTQDEIVLLQKLETRFEFSHEIINILLHFSLIKNREIVPNYILRISETLRNKNISTPRKVINHLKKAYKNAVKKTYQLDRKEDYKESNNKTLEDQIDHKELEELVNSFLGKK